MYCTVIPRHNLICRFDQRSIVRLIALVFFSWSTMLLLNELYLLFSKALDKCLWIGKWYWESKIPNNVLKQVLSTTEKGIRSSASKSTRALVTNSCFGCLNNVSSETVRSMSLSHYVCGLIAFVIVINNMCLVLTLTHSIAAKHTFYTQICAVIHFLKKLSYVSHIMHLQYFKVLTYVQVLLSISSTISTLLSTEV